MFKTQFSNLSRLVQPKLLMVIIAIVLGIYLMDAWTPPRSGDHEISPCTAKRHILE